MEESKSAQVARLLERAQALYASLPSAEFTRTTFVELGEAADVRRPWHMLSAECKLAIFQLTKAYEIRTTKAREAEAEDRRIRVEAAAFVPAPPSSPIEEENRRIQAAAQTASVVETEAATPHVASVEENEEGDAEEDDDEDDEDGEEDAEEGSEVDDAEKEAAQKAAAEASDARAKSEEAPAS